MTLWKKPYIDVTYTGEWKFGKQEWEDIEVYKEYYVCLLYTSDAADE